MSFPARLVASCRTGMLPQPWRLFSRAAEDTAWQRIRKVLCVAEKNDAARGIADLLSNSRMRRVGLHHTTLSLPDTRTAAWRGAAHQGHHIAQPCSRACSASREVAPACLAELSMGSLHQDLQQLVLFCSWWLLTVRGYKNGFILRTNTTCPNVFRNLRPLFLVAVGIQPPSCAPSACAAFSVH